MKSTQAQHITSGAACAIATAVALLLSACGGGSAPGTTPAINSAGPGGTGGTPATQALVLKLALGFSDGAGSTVAHGKPLTVTATVTDKAGKPVANALLAFSTDAGLVSMTPAVGQIATDADGKAVVLFNPSGVSSGGATLLTVMAQANGLAAQAQAAFTVAQPNITFTQVTPAASPAQIKAYGSTLVSLDAYSNGVLLRDYPVTLRLSSACAALDRAVLPANVTSLNGRATFTYKDNGCAQSDTITATLEDGNATANVNLVAASPDATSIELASIVPTDSSIVIQGAGGSGRSETAVIRFKVLDKSGLPVANQTVSFATISTKAVRLSQTSGTTDVNGEVVASLISGTEPTSVRVSATLANGLSTVSDTITVTTGLPVQAAFSLSAETFNFEGYDYDDSEIEMKLLLADQFSNPVADGVPVVVQTDSAAIGSSARGGCTTVNGRCVVQLRSQNPRFDTDASAPQKRAGLATMTFTTLAGSTTPLSGKIAVFLSTSHVGSVTLLNPGAGVSMAGGTLNLTTTSCGAVGATLQISDGHRNPMPSGSSLAISSASKLSGTAYPDTVLSQPPRYTAGFVTGDQGSIHSLAIMPDISDCEEGGPVTAHASALLVVQTPRGNTSQIPVSLTYKAKAP